MAHGLILLPMQNPDSKHLERGDGRAVETPAFRDRKRFYQTPADPDVSLYELAQLALARLADPPLPALGESYDAYRARLQQHVLGATCEHRSRYSCAGCRAACCMGCDEPAVNQAAAREQEFKTAVRWCRDCTASGRSEHAPALHGDGRPYRDDELCPACARPVSPLADTAVADARTTMSAHRSPITASVTAWTGYSRPVDCGSTMARSCCLTCAQREVTRDGVGQRGLPHGRRDRGAA